MRIHLSFLTNSILDNSFSSTFSSIWQFFFIYLTILFHLFDNYFIYFHLKKNYFILCHQRIFFLLSLTIISSILQNSFFYLWELFLLSLTIISLLSLTIISLLSLTIISSIFDNYFSSIFENSFFYLWELFLLSLTILQNSFNEALSVYILSNLQCSITKWYLYLKLIFVIKYVKVIWQ